MDFPANEIHKTKPLTNINNFTVNECKYVWTLCCVCVDSLSSNAPRWPWVEPWTWIRRSAQLPRRTCCRRSTPVTTTPASMAGATTVRWVLLLSAFLSKAESSGVCIHLLLKGLDCWWLYIFTRVNLLVFVIIY